MKIRRGEIGSIRSQYQLFHMKSVTQNFSFTHFVNVFTEVESES